MSPINDLQYKARRGLVLGTTGTGKSTLASRFVFLHPATLVLVYDWQDGEYGTRLGAPVAKSRDDLADKIQEGHRVVCYDAQKAESEPDDQGFAWFCAMAFEVCGQVPGRKLIVIDELQDLTGPQDMPAELKTLLTRGRRRRIDTLLIGSAPNALHTTSRDQVSELYHFRSVDGNALEYARSLKLDVNAIRELPDAEFIFFDNRTGQQERLALWGKKSKALGEEPVNNPKPTE